MLLFVVRIVSNNTLFPSIYTFLSLQSLLHKLLQCIFVLKFKIWHKCLKKYNYAYIIKEITVVRMTLKELKLQCSHSHYKNTQCQLPSCTSLTWFIIVSSQRCITYRIRIYGWRGADKSLAWPTSRCHRTELIVSLERGVCSCAKLKVFSCYRSWKEACQATRAISTTGRRELSSSFFFFSARQGPKGNSHYSDRNIRGTCTNICHRQKLGGPV